MLLLSSSDPARTSISRGGANVTASLMDAGLVDELRLIVYPLIAGEGKALFATNQRRRGLERAQVRELSDGRLSLIYQMR